MKKISTKVTYSVDPLTVLEIRDLAEVWGVPRSEAIRRAVHAAAMRPEAVAQRPLTPEEALGKLQEEPRLSPAAAATWRQAVRSERRRQRSP